MMIDKNNFDQVFFDYFEGGLSVQEKSAVDKFVSENSSYQKDFQSWEKSYVEDEKLQFKKVDSLLANEESAPKQWLKWGSSSMILILLSFLSYAVYVKMSPSKGIEDSENNANKGNASANNNIVSTEITTESNTKEEAVANKAVTLNEVKETKASASNNVAKSKAKNKTARAPFTNQIENNYDENSVKGSANNSSKEASDEYNLTKGWPLVTDATAVNQHNFKFNTIALADKKLSFDSEGQITLSPTLIEDEMNKKSGLEVINLGDPFILYGGVSPIQENPSFAGNTDGIRLKYLARSEWPELKSSFLTNTVSIDGYVNKVKGGLALVYSSDIMGNNQINTNAFSFVYSPKIKVGKWSVEPSVKYTLSERTINWNQVAAGDIFDPRTGTLMASSAFIPENAAASHIMMNTFGAGVLFNGKTIYGGFAVDNLFNPSYGDANFDQQIYVPLKITAQLGTDIRKNSKSNWTYSPGISYRKQGLYNKLWMSNIVKYKNVIAGASFSTADAMLFSLGYSNSNLRLTYSYSLSSLPFNSSTSNHLLPSHQITLRYVIKQQSK